MNLNNFNNLFCVLKIYRHEVATNMNLILEQLTTFPNVVAIEKIYFP